MTGDFDAATASSIATAASGVAGAVASLLATQQARRVAAANARIAVQNAERQALGLEVEAQQAEHNATLAEQDAALAEIAAAFQARQVRKARRQQEGELLATIGASGVTLTGSPLEVLVDNAREAELEQVLLRQRGTFAAAAKGREAQMQRYAAQVGRYQAREIRKAGAFGAEVTRASAPSYTSALLKGLGTATKTAGALARPRSTPSATTSDYTDLGWY